jgi:hypothetical protein
MRRLVGLLVTLLAVCAEVALYVNYQAHEARYHWFTHFFIGAGVALVAMTVWIVEEKRPVPYPVVWLIAGHLIAMLPDFLFAFGIPHRPWMDVFFGHLSAVFVPGHNLIWYGAFLVTLAGYLAADARLRGQQVAKSGGRRRRRR